MKIRLARLVPRGLAVLPALVMLMLPSPVLAQDRTGVNETVTISQRYDLRKTVNGKSAGMVYGFNQATWYLRPAAADGSRAVDAHYYLTGETALNPIHREKDLSGEFDSQFTLAVDGSFRQVKGGPAPFNRGFPMPPPKDAKIGDRWVGTATLVMDPRNAGIWTKVPILIEYSLVGPAKYGNFDVTEVKAKFAVRYREMADPQGDSEILHAEGTRDAQIYLDPISNFPVFIRELVGHETWDFRDGTRMINNGFILTFYRGGTLLSGSESLAEHKQKESDDLRQQLDKQVVPDVTVHDDPRGVAITLENLRFVADSAQLLPGEDTRLAAIVSLVTKLPSSKTILVVGHTAAIGSEQSQKDLSLDRARSIVEALKKGGIDPGRLLVDGRGGTQPIGDNTTDAGRAKNRRVELIILD